MREIKSGSEFLLKLERFNYFRFYIWYPWHLYFLGVCHAPTVSRIYATIDYFSLFQIPRVSSENLLLASSLYNTLNNIYFFRIPLIPHYAFMAWCSVKEQGPVLYLKLFSTGILVDKMFQRTLEYETFQVFTTMKIQILVFWFVMPCRFQHPEGHGLNISLRKMLLRILPVQINTRAYELEPLKDWYREFA